MNKVSLKLVPQPSVEALDKSVLHQLARGNGTPIDQALSGSTEDRITGQFCSIIADNGLGLATCADQKIEFARHTPAGE